MIQSDGELLWQSHCNGFRPLEKAIEDDNYLQSKLGTGANYSWIDNNRNLVAFGHRDKNEKTKEQPFRKGFRGYKYKPIIRLEIDKK